MGANRTSVPELPVILFPSQAAWAKWLEQHHAASPGTWLQIAKKGSGLVSVSYNEAVETALCYGWIDGHKKRHNEDSWIQRFTRRSKTSIWSKINRDKALSLMESGRMRTAGLATIELAKKNGRWDAAYDSSRTSAVPEDLQAALDRNTIAKGFFGTLESYNRYAILFRIQTATNPTLRAKRIERLVQMLERHEKLHP